MNIAHAVDKPPCLARDRVGDHGVAMPECRDAERGCQIKELVAVDILHDTTATRFPENGERPVVGDECDPRAFVPREA